MRKYLLLGVIAVGCALFALDLFSTANLLVNGDTPAPAAPVHIMQGTPDFEPYGGCDEAYLYPDTPGYAWCRDHGYLD